MLIALTATLALAAILGTWALRRRSAAERTRNVILIIIDTVRWDALGCYGNALDPTPNISGIAAEGVRFDQAISSSGWTLPAVASILTGTWPTIHGGSGKGVLLTPIRDELPTAAEIMKTEGFNTLGFANAAFVSPRLHLDRGFDVFNHRYAYNWNVRRADETMDAVLELLGERWTDSNFVMIHFFDPHLDYDPPPAYATKYTDGRTEPALPLTMQACLAMQSEDGGSPSSADIRYVRGVYHGEVACVDAQVGRLVDALKTQGIYDNAMLMITSDHGEEFWEHGGFEHGHTLYDELIRVPLIIKLPAGIEPVERVVDAQVRTLDLMPTVFKLLDIPKPESFVGDSLMPLIRGETIADRIAFSESTLYGNNKRSWRTARYKYIRNIGENGQQKAELYDWRSDPAETRNLVAELPNVAARVHGEFSDFCEAIDAQASRMPYRPSVNMSPREIEMLRSLGYIRDD